MQVAQLSDRSRKRLVALLAEDQLDGDRLLTRLQEFRTLEGVATCSAVLEILANLTLPEPEAESMLQELNEHRSRLRDALGRDPGLRVAAIDFLSNVKKLLRNPTIVELAQLERTERSAVTDPLSELYNRRYFESSLDVEIRRSRRHSLSLSLVMLDLDAFKPVNDLYGHPFGDLVLKRAGRVVQRAVRESDLACRFGGDELVLLLPETRRLGAYAVAERVRRAIERNFSAKPIQDRAVLMTLSGGLAVYPDDGSDSKTLIARADQALYQAKRRGRNRIVIHHSEQRRSIRYPVRLSARAMLGGGGRAKSRDIRAINLSLDGALLATDRGFALSEPVELTLRDSHDTWVVSGRIVRVESDDERPQDRRIAVAFETRIPEACLHRSVISAGPSGREIEGGGLDHA